MLAVQGVAIVTSSPTERHGMFSMGVIPGFMARGFHGDIAHLLQAGDGLAGGGVKANSGHCNSRGPYEDARHS